LGGYNISKTVMSETVQINPMTIRHTCQASVQNISPYDLNGHQPKEWIIKTVSKTTEYTQDPHCLFQPFIRTL